MQKTYRMRGRYDLSIADYKAGDLVQFDNGRYYVFRHGGEFVPLVIDDNDSPWWESGPIGPPGQDSIIPGPPGPPSTVPGPPGESVIGPPGLVYQGEWQFSKEYYTGDVVSHEGSSFIANRNTRYSEPNEHSNAWKILALAGKDSVSTNTHLRTVVRRDESQPQLTPCTWQTIPKPGQALYVFDDTGKTDLAIANNVLTARVIGLAAADGSQKFQSDGIFELHNWQNVIGSIYLEPTRYYYLSTSDAGHLSATPPHSDGHFVCLAGIAISKTRLSLSLDSHLIEL